MSENKIKVLFFAASMGQGGAEKVTATLLNQLDRSRYDLQLLLLTQAGEWLAEVPADVRVRSLDVRLRSMLLPMVKFLRHNRFDVVFSMCSGANALIALAARLSGSGCRVVTSDRNILLNGGLRPSTVLGIPLKFLAYRLASQVTALSGGVADDISRKLWVRRSSIKVLYNPLVSPAIQEKMTEAVDHPWIEDPEARLVVGAGRFFPQKGFSVLLKAFQLVAERVPKARLILLGDGPLLAELGRECASLGIGQKVCFAGFQKNPYRYFHRAQVFAMPSYNEGFCNVIVEAMACGAPVVSTDCPSGPSEIITPGVDGFLVPVGAHRLMAERIVQLLEDEPLRQKMADAASASSHRFETGPILRNYENAIQSAYAG